MRKSTREELMEGVLFFLNKHKVRATYTAVAMAIYPEVEDLRSVMQEASQYLGRRRPYASWVVSRNTGNPTGYGQDEYHKDLFLNDMVLDGIELIRHMLDDDKNNNPRPEVFH